MIRFYAEKFLVADRYVTQLSMAAHNTELSFFSPDARSEFKEKLSWLTITLEELGLGISQQLSSELAAQFDKKETRPSDLIGYTSRLFDIMRREVASVHFLALSYAEKALYEPDQPHFGMPVRAKFPSITYEIDEAAACLALGRTTASVFHSIRCLEAAIRSIARCIGIPDPTKGSERSWHKALLTIKTEIDNRWPSGSRLGGDGRLFEELHAVLSSIQNPWRNSTMHLDQKYSAEEALQIFRAVQALMTKVALRCDEQGEPKA